MTPDPTKRPIRSLLARNCISMHGVALASTVDRGASRVIAEAVRCHRGNYSTVDSKNTSNNDCTVCHHTPALDKTSPALLKTPGIAGEVPQPEEH